MLNALSSDGVDLDGAAMAARAPGGRLFVGRQGIVQADGLVHGFEFLYRQGREESLAVNTWSAAAQDRATQRVLQAVFGPAGARMLAADALVFVNFTRSFLIGDLPVPDEPERLVIEVVESVRVDDAVVAGVRRLRERGFRIALDDFVGLAGQVALLPHADYVKVDCRDLAVRGPALAGLAGATGARLVAEHVETVADLSQCRALGFDLFQGYFLDATLVMNRTPVPTPRTERPLTSFDAVRPRTAVDAEGVAV